MRKVFFMIIGIGGVSTAGKSALAEQIRQATSPLLESVVICQDDFYRNEKDIPKINDLTNWEVPESIDFDAFKNTIIQSALSRQMVIVEGLMVFYHNEIAPLFDHKIFINLPYSEFLRRKSTDMRWGLKPDWYNQYIWDAYQKYGKPDLSKMILLNGQEKFEIDKLLHMLKLS